MIGFGTPAASPLHHFDLREMAGLNPPAGSMAPKVEVRVELVRVHEVQRDVAVVSQP
jgi:carbamate kinase